MNLLEKSDDEIIAIANPIWENLVKSSNMKDYGGFTKDFGTQMLFFSRFHQLCGKPALFPLQIFLSWDLV